MIQTRTSSYNDASSTSSMKSNVIHSSKLLHINIVLLNTSNSRVKTRRFQVGDLVLRKVLHNKGALDLGWEGSFKITEVLTPRAYKSSLLSGEQIPRSWNADHLKMYYQ